MTGQVQFDFRNINVVVTGATSGIGAATAKAFLDAGAKVIGTGTKASAAEYEGVPKGLDYRRLSLDSEESIAAFARSIDRADILVNNAGHIMPQASFAQSVQVNLIAVHSLSTALHGKLAASTLQGGASVVNIASLLSIFGEPHLAGYGAAKAGVVQLTKSLAIGWARTPIRVNSVLVGCVASGMTTGMVNDPQSSKKVTDRTPLGRWGTPQEIASAIMFLSSSAASYITGETLVADGGYTVVV